MGRSAGLVGPGRRSALPSRRRAAPRICARDLHCWHSAKDLRSGPLRELKRGILVQLFSFGTSSGRQTQLQRGPERKKMAQMRKQGSQTQFSGVREAVCRSYPKRTISDGRSYESTPEDLATAGNQVVAQSSLLLPKSFRESSLPLMQVLSYLTSEPVGGV